jgi:hypothetical protein
MPPSFLPCKTPCPKTPPVPVRPFPVNKSWSMCRMRCDARVRLCGLPLFPPTYTPKYASCCALTPTRLSIRQNQDAQPVTVHKKGLRKDNIVVGEASTPPPQQTTFFIIRTTDWASPPDVAVDGWPSPRDASASPSRRRLGEGTVDTRLFLGGDFEVCEPRLGQAAAILEAFEDPVLLLAVVSQRENRDPDRE